MVPCPEPDLLGTAHDHELAARWKVSLSTVRRWRKRAGVPAFGTGTKLDAQGLVGKVARELGVGEPADAGDEDVDQVLALTHREYLELKFKEIRHARRRNTGVAAAQFSKQEREVWDELELAKQTGGRRKTPDTELARLVLSEVVQAWARAQLEREVQAADEAAPRPD